MANLSHCHRHSVESEGSQITDGGTRKLTHRSASELCGFFRGLVGVHNPNGFPFWNGSQLDSGVPARLHGPAPKAPGPMPRCGPASCSPCQKTDNPELLGPGRSRFVVLGLEIGGRWNRESTTFIKLLAKHRAATNPPNLRNAATIAWTSRWAALLAAAAMRSFASSLLTLPTSASTNVDGPCPPICELLTSYTDGAPTPSRLPSSTTVD